MSLFYEVNLIRLYTEHSVNVYRFFFFLDQEFIRLGAVFYMICSAFSLFGELHFRFGVMCDDFLQWFVLFPKFPELTNQTLALRTDKLITLCTFGNTVWHARLPSMHENTIST